MKYLLALLIAVTAAAAHAQNATGYFSVTFTGRASPDWVYLVESQKSDGTWSEIPGAVTQSITPIKFNAPVTVGSTFKIRMRARSTIDLSIFTDPSPEVAIVIPEPNTGPGNVALKLIVVVQLSIVP